MPALDLAEQSQAVSPNPPNDPVDPVNLVAPVETLHVIARPARGLAYRLATRFGLLAFAFYHLPLIVNDFPSLGYDGVDRAGVTPWWGRVFGQVGMWVANHVLQLSGLITEELSGDNGDTAEEYGRLLTGVVVAVIASVIWTIADRRRPRARWVDEALRVVLRYSIALGLMNYALAKIHPFQFREILPSTLEARVGELSAIQLLWAFMSYSRVYSTFAGVMELIIIVLLWFRRTATLGALLCIAVMTNVALMNWCYGVPVKLFSTIIVLSAIVLVLYDARRLAAVLIFHRPAPAAPPAPVFRSRRLNRLRRVVKGGLLVGAAVSCVVWMANYEVAAAPTLTGPLSGTWDVTSFVVSGRDLAQTGEPTRWRRFLRMSPDVAVRREDDTMVYCTPSEDDTAHTLGLTCERTHQDGSFTWARRGDELRLTGTFDHAPVAASLKLRDPAQLRLLRQRFRWTYD